MAEENSSWYPEIMYEEDSKLPFVPIPEGEQMPEILFMFESRSTGEFEPGPEGEKLPIVEMELYQYANMNSLKASLNPGTYDEVRIALGLEPMSVASEKGKKLTNKVRESVTLS